MLYRSFILLLLFFFATTSTLWGGEYKRAIGYNSHAEALSYRLIKHAYFIDILARINIESKTEYELKNVFDFRVGGNYVKPIEVFDDARLNLFYGFLFGKDSGHWDANDKYVYSGTIGLSPEIFIRSNISVEIPFGLILENNSFRIDIETFGSDIFATGGIVFHWYLK